MLHYQLDQTNNSLYFHFLYTKFVLLANPTKFCIILFPSRCFVFFLVSRQVFSIQNLVIRNYETNPVLILYCLHCILHCCPVFLNLHNGCVHPQLHTIRKCSFLLKKNTPHIHICTQYPFLRILSTIRICIRFLLHSICM